MSSSTPRVSTQFQMRLNSAEDSTTESSADSNTRSTQFIQQYLGQAIDTQSLKPLPSSASPIAYDAHLRRLILQQHSLIQEYFARNIDLSNTGFNADKVDGCHVDDEGEDNHSLWTAEKILSALRGTQHLRYAIATMETSGLMSAMDKQLLEALRAEELRERATEFKYQSSLPQTTHLVTHNLGSFDIEFTVLVEHPDGSWRNDMVGVAFLNPTQVRIDLSEPCNIRLLLHVHGAEGDLNIVNVTDAINGLGSAFHSTSTVRIGPR